MCSQEFILISLCPVSVLFLSRAFQLVKREKGEFLATDLGRTDARRAAGGRSFTLNFCRVSTNQKRGVATCARLSEVPQGPFVLAKPIFVVVESSRCMAKPRRIRTIRCAILTGKTFDVTSTVRFVGSGQA